MGCSLGGIRVRRERLWHYASYRLLVSTESTCTERWLRHSDLQALHDALPPSPAFDRVRSLWHEAELSRKRWRSLDLSYLVQRRRFYEAYIAELVFAVSSPDELAFYLGSGRSAAGGRRWAGAFRFRPGICDLVLRCYLQSGRQIP